MRFSTVFVTIFVMLLALSGCTWVKVSEQGQSVAVLDASAAVDCQMLGRLTAISRAKVAGITRSQEKLAIELETIARNEGASMGGNAVVPLTGIEGNQQKFQVYQCP